MRLHELSSSSGANVVEEVLNRRMKGEKTFRWLFIVSVGMPRCMNVMKAPAYIVEAAERRPCPTQVLRLRHAVLGESEGDVDQA